MKHHIALCALLILTVPLAGTASAQQWTWTPETGGNWSDNSWFCDPETGDCTGRTYPSQASDRVLLDRNTEVITLDVTTVTIGSLTMTNAADLTIPVATAVPQTLKIMNEDGLRLEDSGTFIYIEGGKLELYGGGDVLIEGTSHIVFREVDDGRIVFGGKKAYAIVQDLDAVVTTPDGAISAEEGVHGFVSGLGGAGDDEVVMLYNTAIRGDVSIDAHLINNGEVTVDTAGTTLTLCGRPKMGAGTWTVGPRLGDDTSVLAVEAVTLGDRCQLLHIQSGKVDANTFWLSCGKVTMDPPGGSGQLRKLDAAAEKIVQFGRCVPDCACAYN
jgi:hypothetical protein